MEQDIKRLKEKINNIKKYNTYRYDWTEIDIQTVEHLIKAYKEQNDIIKTANIAIKDLQQKLENSIPVSLVKEKIEELKERLIYYQNLKVPEVDDNGVRTGLIVDETIMILKAKIQVLEELLGEEK